MEPLCLKPYYLLYSMGSPNSSSIQHQSRFKWWGETSQDPCTKGTHKICNLLIALNFLGFKDNHLGFNLCIGRLKMGSDLNKRFCNFSILDFKVMFSCFVHSHKIIYNACRAKPKPYYDTIIVIWLFVDTFSSKISVCLKVVRKKTHKSRPYRITSVCECIC